MIKKILSFILILCVLLTSSISAFAYNTAQIDGIINKMLSYSVQDRKNLLDILQPLICTDSGLDVLIGMVSSYKENSGSKLDNLLKEVLSGMDKDMLIRFLKSLKIVNYNTRKHYYDIIINKETMSLPQGANESLEALLAQAYAKHSNLKELFAQDNITVGVIANFMRILPDINDGVAPLVRKANGDFAVGTISASFANSLDNVWIGYQDEKGVAFNTNKAFADWVEMLNSTLQSEQKNQITGAFSAIGILKQKIDSVTVGSGKVYYDESKPMTVSYQQIDSLEGLDTNLLGEDGAIIKVSLSNNDGEFTDVAIGKTVMMVLPVSGMRYTLYRYENGGLSVVKYAICCGDSINALIDHAGYYILKSQSNPFTDNNGWGARYIKALYHRGIVSGKSETEFMPDHHITREEFVKLVVELFDMKDESAASEFADVDKNAWYYPYVSSAVSANILQGVGDNRFGVGENIKRQDMAKIIATILKAKEIKLQAEVDNLFADFNTISDYAKESVLSIYNLGIISGDENKNFHPNNYATRQEAAKMICGMLQTYVEKVGNYE